jgi:PPOX class probable F420-dependent enzyme
LILVDTTALAQERFISITSFKRDGTAVSTPVWCANENGSLLVYSERDSGKVKRIRHDGHVRIAPCSARGRLRGPAVDAAARIVGDSAEVETLLARKYGWMWRGYTRLMAVVRRIRRQAPPPTVTIRIVPR